MKRKSTSVVIFLSLLLFVSYGRLQAQVPGSIEMGPQYADEVFYSMSSGVVKTSPRSLWDIAFYTNAFSAGILINDGAGVELYTYPYAANDGWDSFDTTGMESWTKMYNDPGEWENGAFDRNQKGHPDYGWGVYSSTTHDVIGDSLFLIKTPDGIYRKLNIIRKLSVENKYEIRFAMLDGTGDQTLTLDVNPYVDRAFMAFSFENGIVDREPASADWDILFTKYYGVVQNTPYPVVGVLLNPDVQAARVVSYDPSFSDWTGLDYETARDIIGWDWKYFDFNAMQYLVADTLQYFIKAHDGGVYKLVFNSFAGSSTGIATFTTTLLSALGIPEQPESGIRMYPNPASGSLQVSVPGNTGLNELTLSDLSGRQIRNWRTSGNVLNTLDISGIPGGVYLLSVQTGTGLSVQKLVITK